MLPLRNKQITFHHRRNKSTTRSPCTTSTSTARQYGPETSGSSTTTSGASSTTCTCRTAPGTSCSTPPLLAPPAPPAFTLGPGHSHAVLHFDDPNTGATATKLYNKAIAPLEAKFDGEADNLAVFLASMRDRAWRFNWHRLITVPIDDGTTQNLLTHYGQVSLDNTRPHTATYVNTPTRDAQDNDMFYYFLADSLTNEFRTMVLLYTDTYTVTNIPVATALLKQIIILTRVDNPASTMHIREMLIESKRSGSCCC